LNRKIVRRIIEGAKDEFPTACILEADDGTTAIEELKYQLENDLTFDIILMDFVMVSDLLTSVPFLLHYDFFVKRFL
jgi:CheY-like chemotaxis protein